MTPRADIESDADRCVMCGLCLPHCPTYAIARTEAESPRGRVALMHALAVGELETSEEVLGHLDRCLGCRACERACPSEVPYGRLLRETMAAVGEERVGGPARTARWLLTARHAPRRLLRSGLRLLQRSGLDARLHGRLPAGTDRLQRLVPPLAPRPRLSRQLPPCDPERGWVALFTGCTGELFDGPALAASVRLLQRLGYGVWVPPGQGCCGAFDLAAGDRPAACDHARRNAAAFSEVALPAGAGPVAVVGITGACTATLKEYGEWAAEVPGAAALAARAEDITAFLARVPWPDDLRPAALRKTVALHEPCSVRNILCQGQAAYSLLGRVPGLRAVPLPGNERCCGAAGSHMLSEPETADQLGGEKIAALQGLGVETLVTTNIGCALHLAAGMRETGLPCEVVHPVVLLERQLS